MPTMEANNIAFVHRFITSLVFTDVVETSILVFLLRVLPGNKALETSRIIFAGLWASFSTIPYVWFVFPYLVQWPASTAIIFAEVFAFLMEALFYKVVLRLNWKTALFVSLVCNAASYFLGPILRAHGLWIYW
jgi:hypothetical protein